MDDVVIIGGGLGGLAAAVELGARGLRVRLLEAHATLGGKAGTVTVDGVTADTGPSVLTMPDVLDALLTAAGRTLSDHITLRPVDPGFRYVYPDGAVVDVYHAVGDTLDSVRSSLGADAAHELESFLAYSQRIWDAASPYFVYGPAPTLDRLAGLGLRDFAMLRHIDALRSMRGGIAAHVSNPHLRTLLARYATYNGSDPRSAPATLNCIAHVELALGGFGVDGGIFRIVEVLADTARSLGVRIHTGTRVAGIETENGRVSAVKTACGTVFPTSAVVANADAAHVGADLLSATDARRSAIDPEVPRSMSGWTALARAKRTGARVAHTVVFPEDYDAEFADIFDRRRPPAEPTVYLCAQEACHRRTGWADHEPVFAMINCPPEPAHGRTAQAEWDAVSARVHRRLVDQGHLAAEDAFVWTRSPTDLAVQYPGSRGAIYGASSNDMWSAFRRPANRIRRVGGLYMASGSAHPGGGMPLAMQSGRLAAEALLVDRGEPALATAG